MKIIDSAEFDEYRNNETAGSAGDAAAVDAAVREIIEAVRTNGDQAVRDYAARFDKSSPQTLEVPAEKAHAAWAELRRGEPELAAALELSADHLRRFALLQRAQFGDFETEMAEGLFTGQRVIPVERAAIYVPAGRFPIISSVLMGMIPAFAAGVPEVVLASPPLEDGLPDRRILAAAALAASLFHRPSDKAAFRAFAAGGAQAIAALALGTESVPRVSVIAGPGNKYVAAAKRLLFGETGIDFIAGPTDVLIIADALTSAGGLILTGLLAGALAGTGMPGAGALPRAAASGSGAADLIAADMLAQAEHDPDARARALLASAADARAVERALEKRLAALPEHSRETARASLDAGGLIIIYHTMEEAVRIANVIAPEHLELHVENPDEWAGDLKNYGSLFCGRLAAEVLGDYSAGINHTLPTSGSARYTGGLSVRHFLKTVTTLRCAPGKGFEEARAAAEILGRAEGLAAHAESAAARKR